MKTTTKTIEEEINEIRLKIYEETKNLTEEQYADRLEKVGEEYAKKYGFKRVARAE